MLLSIIDFVCENVYKKEIEGKYILEIGSRDVNGGVRPLIMKFNPLCYIGIDIIYGNGVDFVWDAEQLDKIPFKEFDFIFCTETLEHVSDWRKVVNNMKNVLKIGGKILITVPSKGFERHEYPQDYWRFEMSDIRKIFANYSNLTILPNKEKPGVLFKGTKANNDIINLNDIEVAKV